MNTLSSKERQNICGTGRISGSGTQGPRIMNDQTLRKVAGERAEAQTETQVKQSRRPRSMTTLKLQWLAERVRKCRQLKEQIEAGSYKVDSQEVAKAILGVYEEDV